MDAIHEIPPEESTEFEGGPAFEVLAPARQTLPLVLSSPHSGRAYPAAFVAASQLDPLALRRSEDSFVDEIFMAAPRLGAPLVRALFPRAFVDLNREPLELDPDMFEDALPSGANTRSPRVAAGLGTIPRIVANGEEIYAGKLRVSEALERIERLYRPFHRQVRQLVETTRRHFGFAVLLDCHSMPASGASRERDGSLRGADIVLGDAHGRSCASGITDRVETMLAELGYRVQRNQPYAGGFITQHYGAPASGVHALQIEINRRLYMDEQRFERRPYLAVLADHMAQVIATLGRMKAGELDGAVAAEPSCRRDPAATA